MHAEDEAAGPGLSIGRLSWDVVNLSPAPGNDGDRPAAGAAALDPRLGDTMAIDRASRGEGGAAAGAVECPVAVGVVVAIAIELVAGIVELRGKGCQQLACKSG